MARKTEDIPSHTLSRRRRHGPISPRELRHIALAAVLIAPLFLAGGCAGTYRLRSSPPQAEAPTQARQGESWEVVMRGPEVSEARLPIPDEFAPEYARRDGALSARTARLPTAAEQHWPQTVPSVERPRRIFIGRSPDQFIHFRPIPPQRRYPRHHHHRPAPYFAPYFR